MNRKYEEDKPDKLDMKGAYKVILANACCTLTDACDKCPYRGKDLYATKECKELNDDLLRQAIILLTSENNRGEFDI